MSNGIGPNPLNAISKVYLDQIANEGYDKPDEKLKTDRNMFNIPKDEQQAAKERLLAKAKAKRAAKMEALDPVGKEDGDVNNDGKKDSTDSYLMKRRKAIGKAIKSKMSEGVRDMDPEKGTAERKARLEKKRGMKMDDHPEYKKEEVETVAEGDGDPCWDTHKQVGMKKKGGKMVPNCVPKTRTESFSSWRNDLSEVMSDDVEDKPIKEKKVNNKVTINPKLGEAVESMGGEIVEMVEVSEDEIVANEEMSPEELALQKRRTAIDQMIARKRKQQLDKSKKEPVKTMGEGLSIDQQMKISQEYNRKSPEEKKAANSKLLGAIKKVKQEKDTRTDAQKMTDATGPRPGSRYRGD